MNVVGLVLFSCPIISADFRDPRPDIPNSGHIQEPFCSAALSPEVHRRRRQIFGSIPSEGDTALLPSHFGGVQQCCLCFNIQEPFPSRPCRQRSARGNVRSSVTYPPKDTPHCCPVTSVVFSDACFCFNINRTPTDDSFSYVVEHD